MASEEPMFDPSLVKKKKKKVVIDLDDFDAELKKSAAADAPEAVDVSAASKSSDAAPAEGDDAGGAAPAAGANGEEGGDLFGGLKKKSKKKKALPLDLDEAAEKAEPSADAGEGAGAEGDLDFGDLKKKTKKTKKKTFDLDAFEKELDGAEGDGADGEGGAGASRLDTDRDLGDDPFAQDDGAAEGGDAAADAPDAWLGSDRDYTYQELLARIFKTLRAQNPALSGDRKKYSIVPPVVQREGSKKTMFANLIDICKRMHRQPEHVLQYLFSELGTIGNLDGSQRLIIKGRFTQKQIEHVLRTYIVEYVTCKTCKSPNTLLTKENRIYFMTCESCGSQRSVQTIKAGFMAQTTKRKKMA
ncbi:translation initiation factor eIF-2 beta subunit [Tilletia horrida]|uniref:Translation initiation factor eIF-2 beta subunit n=1 Tax=Tilletia horrida TaxID=155126 RepID=A0AAN6G823_9BASI|nr:translation initiation factor eIF-2 beta subunit [Tilletia horrida]KAK0522428.1 translation initiation factor eIF-2 beta subunit [Tilletia horrida]KAK0533561.1 translation initiation factor eIF-2 beta subunit [Tilletia horrida]KAK0567685.1 translation initiation factor eIF-2 beta subunit [Tilletia horrida]